jgi:hypothetical protein
MDTVGIASQEGFSWHQNNRAQGLRQEGMKLTSPYGTACSAPVESLRSGFPVPPDNWLVKG